MPPWWCAIPWKVQAERLSRWTTLRCRIRDELGDFIASRYLAASRVILPIIQEEYNPHPLGTTGVFLSNLSSIIASIIRNIYFNSPH